jgi:hypothetical protein
LNDRNVRAASGADLLILEGLSGKAHGLLESVAANEAAPAAGRAHALFRLEQLSIGAGEWRRALDLAGRIQDETPFNLTLRKASLSLLSPERHIAGGPAPLPEELLPELAGLRAKLQSDRLDLCNRFFAETEGATPPGACPLEPKEGR